MEPQHQPTAETCQHPGCGNPAVRCPRFRFYASAEYGPHPPIEMILKLGLCEEHGFEPDDFLVGSNGWELLERTTKALGKAKPVRERTEFGYATLEEAEKFFAGAKPA